MKKRIISIVLILALLITEISVSVIPVSALSDYETSIYNRIYELYDKLGANSYFTTTHTNSCGSKSSGHSCDYCKLSSIITKDWFKNKFGTLSTSQFPKTYYSGGVAHGPDGWSCFGFATFAEWYIFHNNQSDKISTKYIGTYDYNSSGASNIQIGDLIRLGNGHSAIAISHNSTGVEVLDCNWSGSYNCAVSIHTIKYSSYSSFSISRSTTAIIPETPVNPTISVNKSNISLGIFNNTTTTISVNTAGNYDHINYTSSTSCCTVGNPQWSGNTCVFTVTSKAAGNAKVEFSMQDSSNNTLASTSVSVSVSGATLSASSSNITLSLSGTNSTTVTMTAGGDLPDQFYMNNSVSNGNVSTSWANDWNGNSINLTVTGISGGTDTITVKLLNSSNNAVIATKTISVTVTAQNYSVTYNANGGSNAPSSQTKQYGKDLTLTTSKPTGKSYTVTFNGNGGTVSQSSKTYTQSFKEWNTNTSGTGTTYLSGGIYSNNSNVTLYAQYNKVYIDVSDPTRSGYYFMGWYDSTAKDDYGIPTGKKYTDTTPIEKNITLYALWSTSSSTLIWGDLDQNGEVDFINDVVGANNLRLNIITAKPISRFLADVDADGEITLITNSDGTTSINCDIGLINALRQGKITQSDLPAYKKFNGVFVNTKPKISYDYGEAFNSDGVTVIAKYSNGTTYTFEDDITVTGYDPYKIGKQTLMIHFYQYTTTLEVTVNAPKYVLSFDANGGTVSSGGKTVTFGSSIGTLPTPTRVGYTFLGWSYSNPSSTYITSSTMYSYNSNKTVYAQWKQNQYTVAYNANGGSNVPTSQSFAFGQEVIVPSNIIPKRLGYTFLGYSTVNTASSAALFPGDTIIVESNKTLYAVWKEANSITTDVAMYYTPDFERQTIVFKYTADQSGTYWFDSSDVGMTYRLFDSSGNLLIDRNNESLSFEVELAFGKSYYLEIDSKDILNHSIAVTYLPNEYVIALFDSMTGEYDYYNVVEGDNFTLPQVYHDGYTFLGWSTSSTATSATYSAGDVFTTNANTTLYAVWKADTYTVIYNANGGSGTPSSQTKIYGTNLTLTTTKPTKSYTITYNANGGSVSTSSKTVSCTFNNWNTNQSGTGTSYSSGGTYSNNAGATLYAQWSNPTAGTLATPTRNGYTFDGWYTSSSGGTKVTSSTTITGNITLYAHWSAVPSVKLGDVNNDGEIDAADAGLISRYDAGFITLSSEQLQAGDVNKDGEVDAADAGLISRYDAGFISSLG